MLTMNESQNQLDCVEYHLSVCCMSKNSTKCHYRSDAGKVEKYNGRQALEVEAIFDVTDVMSIPSFNVVHQATTQSGDLKNHIYGLERLSVYPAAMIIC